MLLYRSIYVLGGGRHSHASDNANTLNMIKFHNEFGVLFHAPFLLLSLVFQRSIGEQQEGGEGANQYRIPHVAHHSL